MNSEPGRIALHRFVKPIEYGLPFLPVHQGNVRQNHVRLGADTGYDFQQHSADPTDGGGKE